MKNLLPLLSFLLLLTSCSDVTTTSKPEVTPEKEVITDSIKNTADQAASDTSEEAAPISNFANFFVIVVDSSKNYYTLNKEMYRLASTLQVEVDTMNRSYNKKKDLICLSENDEDDIYAGEYFPRRYPSTYLSLEYLDSFSDYSEEKMIGLIGGIYETVEEAEKALLAFKKENTKARVIEAEVFVGCMH